MDEKTEYPKWKYHAEIGGIIVHDAHEESALGLGWHDCPAKARGLAKLPVVQPIKPVAIQSVDASTKIIRKAKA